MKIEVHIPSLDRLCDLLEKAGGIPSVNTVPATKDTPAETTTPKAKSGGKAKADAKPKEPDLTVEDVTGVAEKFIALKGPTELRALLDGCGIKGLKISTCDAKFYAPIKAALESAIAGEDPGDEGEEESL